MKACNHWVSTYTFTHVNYTPSVQGVDINTLFIFRPQGMFVVFNSYMLVRSLCTFYRTLIVLFINSLCTLTYAPTRIVWRECMHYVPMSIQGICAWYYSLFAKIYVTLRPSLFPVFDTHTQKPCCDSHTSTQLTQLSLFVHCLSLLP